MRTVVLCADPEVADKDPESVVSSLRDLGCAVDVGCFDGGGMSVERLLDDLNGPFDAGTEAPGFGEQDRVECHGETIIGSVGRTGQAESLASRYSAAAWSRRWSSRHCRGEGSVGVYRGCASCGSGSAGGA